MIDQLREEAGVALDQKKFGYRSCWNCNPSHEHLRDVDYVICCFACGRWFFRGVDITEEA